MYEIYKTKAYILRSYTVKDSDQRVLLFTKDFGLIWANASGSKKDVSKFRNFLQNLTELEVFLVFAKSGYRITGGEFIENLYFSLKEKTNEGLFKEKIKIIKSILNLLEKVFVQNEEDRDIFELLEKFFALIKEIDNEKELKEKELLFLTELFYLWGYFDKADLPKGKDDFNLNIQLSDKEQKELRDRINSNISKISF